MLRTVPKVWTENTTELREPSGRFAKGEFLISNTNTQGLPDEAALCNRYRTLWQTDIINALCR